MSSKRKAVSSTLTRVNKVPKLDKEQVKTQKKSPAKLQELKLALNQNSCNSEVLRLIQEIVTTTALDQTLSINILKFSIRIKNADVARQVLHHQNVDLKTKEGGEILEAAVNVGNAVIAKLLMEFHADVNVRDPQDNSSLVHKVLRNDEIKNTEELVQLMLKHGANVNAIDESGCSVLNEVIGHKQCSIDLVLELLKLGANVTDGDPGSQRDDIYQAFCCKPELLPRLVQHQVPDEQSRDLRGLMAIAYLIRSKHDGKLRIMKEILDLGIQVNTPINLGQEPFSLLSAAFKAKKKDVVALLIKYGADVHEKDEYGHTPLYQAMGFKGYTNSSRLLLEFGAKIDERDMNGCYPIHGACKNYSLRNIHLLLNLGADINAIDNQGRTPIDSMNNVNTDAFFLIIKYVAFLLSKNEEIRETRMKRFILSTFYYQKCTKELAKMKKTYICDGVSYFTLLSEDVGSMMELMKNSEVARSFKQNRENLSKLFPIYRYMLLHSFEIAELQYSIILKYLEALQETLERVAMPVLVIEKIASYVKVNLLPVLKRCHNDFYMALHKSLKNNQTDKEKIL